MSDQHNRNTKLTGCEDLIYIIYVVDKLAGFN